MFLQAACLLLTTLQPSLLAGPADDPPTKEVVPLQGTWKLTSLEIEGKASDLPANPPWWVIKENKVQYGGAELAVLTLDAGATPKSMNLTFRNPERVYEAIYTVAEGTLKICVNRRTEGVKERPIGFATEGKPDLRLLVFERVKDDTAETLSGFVGIQIQAVPERKELVINAVFEGSPAKKAGLQKDDVLVKVAGNEATELAAVVKMIQQTKPRSDLHLRIRRGGNERDVTVKVGVMPFYLLD